MNSWHNAARQYLARLGESEYAAGLRAHVKAGRKAKTFRYNPSEYHRRLIDFLNADDENGFKSLKSLEGYNSEVGV